MDWKLTDNRPIWQQAAELFDLPPDLVERLPHIEVVGNSHFYMEHHRGILSYSGQEIDINGESCIIRVYGEDMGSRIRCRIRRRG